MTEKELSELSRNRLAVELQNEIKEVPVTLFRFVRLI